MSLILLTTFWPKRHSCLLQYTRWQNMQGKSPACQTQRQSLVDETLWCALQYVLVIVVKNYKLFDLPVGTLANKGDRDVCSSVRNTKDQCEYSTIQL